MINITKLEWIARLLYTPPDGQQVPQPRLQPGMTFNYKGREALTDRVNFSHGTWRYYALNFEEALKESLISDPKWSPNCEKPDIKNGDEYQITVFLRGIMPVRALTQTSLAKGSEVYLEDIYTNVVYIAKTSRLKRARKVNASIADKIASVA